MTDENLVDELAALERARAQALMNADVDTLSGMLDDDLLYVHSSGGTDDKANLLRSIAEGAVVYRTIELTVDQVMAGASTLIARERMQANIKSGERVFDVDSIATSVWTRRSGGLRMLAFLSVPRVPHPEPTA